MSRTARSAIFIAATALLLLLAWWLLGPGGTRTPEPGPAPPSPPRPSMTPGAGTVPSPGPRAGPAPSTDVATAPASPGAAPSKPGLPLAGRVLDPSGRPVAGAQVGAFARNAFQPASVDLRRLTEVIFGPASCLARTTSLEDGTFRIDTLGPGRYVLAASAPGFAPAREEDVLLEAGGAARPVDLRLSAGRTLEVRVVDGTEKPVAGAELVVAETSLKDASPFDPLPFRAATDAEGKAAFSGLAPGRVLLLVRTASGPEMLLSFDVPAPGEVVVRLGGTASLLLRVKGPTGAPVEGAEATALLENRGVEGGFILRGRTDPEGTVRWDALPALRVMMIVAEKEGLPPVATGGPGGAPGGDRIELKDGETAEREILLKTGCVLSGTVRRRPGDAPVPGARVTLFLTSLLMFGPGRSATADADGAFHFDAVPEGEARIYAVAAGAATPSSSNAQEPPAPSPVTPMGRSRKPEDSELVVQIAAGAAEVRKDVYVEAMGTISGKVLGPGGPVAGARVDLGTGGASFMGSGRGTSDVLPGPLLTGTDGQFEFRGVPAGTGLIARAAAQDLIAGSSAPLDVAAGGSVAGIEIRLAAGGTLLGRVTGPDGKALGGARVRVQVRPTESPSPGGARFDGSGSRDAFADAEGAYAIHALPAGVATLTVESPGFASASRGDLSVVVGAETRADLSLVEGRPISGVARFDDGRPVEGARITARIQVPDRSAPGLRAYSATSGADGAFRMVDLPPGTYAIVATARGLPRTTLPAVDAGTEGLEIRFPPSMRIRGTVLDPLGNPRPGARISAEIEGGGLPPSGARSGEDGTFSIDDIPPGTYKVLASDSQGKFTVSAPAMVQAGAEDVVLRLRPK